MKKSGFSKAVIAAALFLVATPLAASSAEHHHNKATGGAAGGAGALVDEMRALDGVFREVVSAVALGDGHRVYQALESMHGKMEQTQEALHKGEVKLRKNASKAAEFEKMDKDFHASLEKLAKAAHSGNRHEMTAMTKKLLDGCVSCHEKFRP